MDILCVYIFNEKRSRTSAKGLQYVYKSFGLSIHFDVVRMRITKTDSAKREQRRERVG